MLKTAVLILACLLTLGFAGDIQAQTQIIPDEKFEAVIEKVTEEREIEVMGRKQLYQKMELLITQGSLKGEKVAVENGNIPTANAMRFEAGEEVVVSRSKGVEGRDYFFITDYVRRGALWWLLGIFVFLTVLVGRWRGVTSLLGMGVSFAVIFLFILPRILQGSDPILTAIVGSMMIVPVSFYLSHGLNKKTTVAVIGTAAALVITGILASIFVEAAKLSGFVSEEAGFLQVATQGLVNIKGLLLAGIIVGVLGVLDDVTISQAAIVTQLKDANKKIKPGELYKRAMDVGQDHIASMVNTLVLVYAGAAMPLLLLFVNTPHPFLEVINYEMIADEIIRTLVGSIGLVLAVPITTFIAVVGVEAGKRVDNSIAS